jgi:hypothetical protein
VTKWVVDDRMISSSSARNYRTDPDVADPTREKSLGAVGWDSKHDAAKRNYVILASSPAHRKMVAEATRPRDRRTRPLLLGCDGHQSGYAIALTVENSLVRIIYLKSSHEAPSAASLPASIDNDDPFPSLGLTCQRCQKTTKRSSDWLLGKALRQLASGDRSVWIN